VRSAARGRTAIQVTSAPLALTPRNRLEFAIWLRLYDIPTLRSPRKRAERREKELKERARVFALVYILNINY
jgi:hypothetical protein